MEESIIISYFEARYLSINWGIKKFLEKFGGKVQVVELAMGYSPGGLKFINEDRISKYIGTDLEGVIKEIGTIYNGIIKEKGLNNRGKIDFLNVDVLNRKDFEKLLPKLNPEDGLVVVNEGLESYLNEDEKKIMAGNIRWLLSYFKNAWWITPDIDSRERMKGTLKIIFNGNSGKDIFGVIKYFTGRDIWENYFGSIDEAKRFYGSLGF